MNRLRFSTPSAVDAADVRLWIGGVEREASAVRVVGDSLLYSSICRRWCGRILSLWSLPPRCLHNATVFARRLRARSASRSVAVGRGGRAASELWYFCQIYPAVSGLIGDLQVAPSVFSPNGDGINDRVQIRFALFKAVDATPSVRIFDLAGREVAALYCVWWGCVAVV